MSKEEGTVKCELLQDSGYKCLIYMNRPKYIFVLERCDFQWPLKYASSRGYLTF